MRVLHVCTYTACVYTQSVCVCVCILSVCVCVCVCILSVCVCVCVCVCEELIHSEHPCTVLNVTGTWRGKCVNCKFDRGLCTLMHSQSTCVSVYAGVSAECVCVQGVCMKGVVSRMCVCMVTYFMECACTKFVNESKCYFL